MTAINRILIVDDEDNVRRMLSTAFALQGFETHCANNGRTALHLFADIHPDVVLMDIRMPEMDGIKALKEMRSHECHERCNSDPHPTPEIRSRG